MLCKAGNLSKRDIGSIKIQTKVTYVEISEQTSNSLLKFVKEKKPIERHIMVKNPPKLDRVTSQPSQNKNRRSSKLFLKGKDEEGLNKPKNIDFKGKRKSDRWKKIEKRTKPRSDTSKLSKDKKNNKRSKKIIVKNKKSKMSD